MYEVVYHLFFKWKRKQLQRAGVKSILWKFSKELRNIKFINYILLTQIKNVHSSLKSRIKNDSGNLIQSKPVKIFFSRRWIFCIWSEGRRREQWAKTFTPRDASSLAFPPPRPHLTSASPSHPVTHAVGSRECFSTLATRWESSGRFKKRWRWGQILTELVCGVVWALGFQGTGPPDTPTALPFLPYPPGPAFDNHISQGPGFHSRPMYFIFQSLLKTCFLVS